MASAGGPTLAPNVLNPLTPMALLQPEIASQVVNGTYLHIGSLAVLIWDILQNLRNDSLLITKHRIGVVTVAYFLSRIAGLVYALGRACLLTIEVEDCRTLELANMSFLTICLCLDTFLFYVRVCAVYCKDTFVVVFFGVCWLGVVSTAALVPPVFADSVVHIHPTNHCVELMYPHSRSLKPPSLAILFYDMFVFVATSYRFYRLYSLEGTTLPRGLKIAFFGTSMPAFSKAMLHESQLYYLMITLWKNASLICWLIFGSKQELFVLMHLTPATVILSNILTCRVFRNTKLGLVREPVELDTLHMSTNADIRSFTNATVQRFTVTTGRRSGVVVGHTEGRDTCDFNGQNEVNQVESSLAVRKEIATMDRQSSDSAYNKV